MDNDLAVDELNAWDVNGMTPLQYAVFIGDKEKVQRLLEVGADPNRPSSTGGMPLWHAEDDFGLIEIAKVLRSTGPLPSNTGDIKPTQEHGDGLQPQPSRSFTVIISLKPRAPEHEKDMSGAESAGGLPSAA